MKLNKILMFVFLLLVSVVGVNAIDLNNISFTNQEFYNGAITASKVLELSNGKLAVAYIRSGSSYLKICDLDSTNCGTEIIMSSSAVSIDLIEDTTNTKILGITGRTSSAQTYQFDLNATSRTLLNTFNAGATDYVSAVQMNSTDFVIAYQDTATSSNMFTNICKLEGSSCAGEVNQFGAAMSYTKIIKKSDGGYGIALANGVANARIEHFTSSMVGTGATSFNTGATSHIDMIEGSDNKLKIVYRDGGNSNLGTFQSLDLDGTNSGGEIVIDGNIWNYNSLIEIDNRLFNTFWTGNTGITYNINFNLTGGDISSPSRINGNDNNLFYMSSIINSNNELVISYGDSDTNKGEFAISEVIFTSGAVVTINNPIDLSFQNSLSISLNVSTDLNTNLTYILNGGTETTLCDNCNSSTNITITGIEGLNNLTVLSNLTGDLTNSTINFTVDTINPILEVNLPTQYTFYNDFNFSQYINFSDTNIDTCVVTISDETSANCNSTSYNFTFNGNHTINITATDLAGNTNTSLNNIMLINPQQYFYFTYTNGTAISNFTFGGSSWTDFANISTYNSLISIGSNNLTFSKLGFATTDIIFTVNTSSNINLTSNITASTIVLQILDGDNGGLLTGLTTITLIATVGSNTTTTTGLVNISNINFVNGAYQIIAEHTGYATETIYFNYDNQETLNKDIYMINSTGTDYGIITLEVTATTGEFVENAICNVLEWMSSDSAFVSVGEGQTNINGQTTVNIHIGVELYKFKCSKSGISSTSSSQIIQSSGTILPIVLDVSSTAIVNTFGEFSFNFTNTTIDSQNQLLTYNFNDGNNLVTEACINVYQKKGTKTTLLSQNCSSSASGTLLKIININQTFDTYATASVTTGGVLVSKKQLIFKGIEALNFALKQYNLDIVIPILFAIIGIAIGFALTPQNIFISVISTIVMTWFSVLVVPTIISGSIALFITFISILMLYGGQKK